MALILADRVKETCSSPGTGAATLLGAQTGFQTFLSGVGNGNTCYYTIADQAGSRWEVGIGTYSSSGNTLTRTTPLSGSSVTPVNFSSGTQDIFVTYPAEKAVYGNGTTLVAPSGTINDDGQGNPRALHEMPAFRELSRRAKGGRRSQWRTQISSYRMLRSFPVSGLRYCISIFPENFSIS